MENIDLSNIQLTNECVKQTTNFGEIIYRNICNGTQAYVPWGSLDWFIGLLLIGVIVCLFVFLIKILQNLN